MIGAQSRILALVILSFLSVTVPELSAQITKLDISQQNAQVLDRIADYPDLKVLSISCLEELQRLPDGIGQLTKLKELTINNGNRCAMNPVIPESIGNLRSLERLVLYGAQDPFQIGRQAGPQPSKHHKFPSSMSQLKQLIYLDLRRNGYEELPSFIEDLPNLTELRLEFNDLHDLPALLGALPRLAKVDLGNNCRITTNQAKMKDLRRRFPRILFEFDNEYSCPGEE